MSSITICSGLSAEYPSLVAFTQSPERENTCRADLPSKTSHVTSPGLMRKIPAWLAKTRSGSFETNTDAHA